MSARKIAKYEVVNRRTGQIVGRAATLNSARRTVDRHDLTYGAAAHTFRPAQECRA